MDCYGLILILFLASPCDSLDNYEEDFQSSVSGEQVEGHAGAAASGSEDIEEEVASGPASTASAVSTVLLQTTNNIAYKQNIMCKLLLWHLPSF
jgi:hypothetical protein